MKAQSHGGLRALAAGSLLTSFGLLVLVAVVLKETPLFWRNAGGYPVELREWVLDFFYPALAIYFLWLTASTGMGWLMLRSGIRTGVIHLLVATLNWMLLAVIVTIGIWNNVENLLQGKPLHYHAP